MKATLKQTVLKAMGMPEFIAKGQPEICLLGFEHISVENYISILQYTSNEIVLRLLQGKVQIQGSGLCVKDIGDGIIRIAGRIQQVQFRKEG